MRHVRSGNGCRGGVANPSGWFSPLGGSFCARPGPVHLPSRASAGIGRRSVHVRGDAVRCGVDRRFLCRSRQRLGRGRSRNDLAYGRRRPAVGTAIVGRLLPLGIGFLHQCRDRLGRRLGRPSLLPHCLRRAAVDRGRRTTLDARPKAHLAGAAARAVRQSAGRMGDWVPIGDLSLRCADERLRRAKLESGFRREKPRLARGRLFRSGRRDPRRSPRTSGPGPQGPDRVLPGRVWRAGIRPAEPVPVEILRAERGVARRRGWDRAPKRGPGRPLARPGETHS